jgi:hypothetical protein
MQDAIVLVPGLAERLGRDEDSIRTVLHKNRGGVPRPDGRVGGVNYWTREHFDAWFRARG